MGVGAIFGEYLVTHGGVGTVPAGDTELGLVSVCGTAGVEVATGVPWFDIAASAKVRRGQRRLMMLPRCWDRVAH